MTRPVIAETTPTRPFHFGRHDAIPLSAIEQEHIDQAEDRERLGGLRCMAWLIALDALALGALAMTFVCFNH